MSPADAPRHRWRRWAGHLAWVLLFAVVYFGARFYQQRTLIEGTAPALQAMLVNGSEFSLASLHGQPVLVYFWATWCPVCRLKQGSIESLATTYRVVSVALQSGGSTDVLKYINEHGLRVPVINDPDGAIARAWGVRATPTSFIVDGNGLIRFRETGYTTASGLRLRMWFVR